MRFLIFCLACITLMHAEPITTLPVGSANIVCLTFDDGPKNGPTEALLDLLRTEKIQATFFVNGKWLKHDPDLILRMQTEGHDIGNHTYSHVNLSTSSRQKITEELQKNNILITQITKKTVRLMRAPGGQYSPDVYTVAQELKLLVVNWSLNTADYQMEKPMFDEGEAVFVRSPDMIVQMIKKKIQPGSIILLHNGNDETVTALRELIPWLKKQGYRFAKVSDFYK
jgi:peptidoglycan/xylan/chitin deacetylase (PgdA/CDA1 family)